MSQFDVAVGMDATTLNQGVSGLYANSQARADLFKGSQTGTLGTAPYTADWDIQTAPTFTLAPPTATQWNNSINSQGQHPTTPVPTENFFQLVFPQFYGSYTLGTAAPVSGTTEVIVFAQMTISGSTLSLAPLAVWLDETKMTGWDQFILNQVILTQVLQKADTMLSGLHIPPLSFALAGANLQLTPPQGTISGGWLILAASLQTKGTVDITGVTWPQQSLFVLLSSDVINQVASGLGGQLAGKQFSDDGSKNGGKYSYNATLERLDGIQADATDLTKINAQALFSFQANVAYNLCGLKSAAGAL